MKRFWAIFLILCTLLSLSACGASEGSSESTAADGIAAEAGGFRVGFGRADITPRDSVPMASYGNARNRMSEGLYSNLYINVLAVDDGQTTLLLMTIDHSWFSDTLAKPIKGKISQDYGIPAENILMQGTHTHAGPEAGLTDIAGMSANNTLTVEQSVKAVAEALADLKPADIYVSSVETEGMNFVRRYIMDDGSLTGDNYDGTGTRIDRHETDADGEVQLLKFVREGGADVLIVNFQAHPHLDGKSLNLSAQTPGAIRDAVEEKFGNHCIYWQGAAGNLNTHSRIEEENKFERSNAGRVAYGKAMAEYIASVYDSMEPAASGPIRLLHYNMLCEVNHSEDHLVGVATNINKVWEATGSAAKAMEGAAEYGIKSVYHAGAILKKAVLPASSEIPLVAFCFGDVSGVVVPYEMFDTSGMQLKSRTPFVKTFLFGYANPGSFSYMPDEAAYANIGYEGTMCRFAVGTAEKLVDQYLAMLTQLKG